MICRKAGQGISWACKGLEPGTGQFLHVPARQLLGDSRPLAVVTGPTFAVEVAANLPTAITVAGTEPEYCARIARILHGGNFRAYTSDDIVGAELGGAVKNVLAIATGICDGMGLGANARAALVTRGLAEMMRLGEALGAQARTLTGLTGMGDLVLTCTSDLSRNRRLGLALGAGKSVADAVAEIGQVVEGVKTAGDMAAGPPAGGGDADIRAGLRNHPPELESRTMPERSAFEGPEARDRLIASTAARSVLATRLAGPGPGPGPGPYRSHQLLKTKLP